MLIWSEAQSGVWRSEDLTRKMLPAISSSSHRRRKNSGKNGTLYRKKQTAWRRKQTKAREELSAEMARLAPLEKENAQLKEQVEALRPDAEAHVMLRGQVGAIECEARQRAAELEEHTAGQMHKALDLFRQQYQILMSTFETASSHMTAELRKMEVTLAQLPRTMDQTGVELDRLASALEKGTDAKSDKK